MTMTAHHWASFVFISARRLSCSFPSIVLVPEPERCRRKRNGRRREKSSSVGVAEMGKGGDLWDDSALVHAFDRAVSTFKAMHGKNTQAKSSVDEKPDPPASEEQEEPISDEATNEKKDKSIVMPCGSIEKLKQPSEDSKTIEQTPLQETDPGKQKHVSETKTGASDLNNSDRNMSSIHEELLGRYYELEEQSRNVLQQLQQTNYWDSEAPYGASTYQQPHVAAYNATAQDPHSSTGQSSCCYWNCPLVSVSCCSGSQPSGSSASVSPFGGYSVSLTCDHCPGASTTFPTGSNSMQPPTKLSTNDNEVTKAAMMTAEGAFNFMRSAISGDPSSQGKESESGKEGTRIGLQPNFDITGTDSELAVVLNAWFAAGFYTGRYVEKKQQQQRSNEHSQQ